MKLKTHETELNVAKFCIDIINTNVTVFDHTNNTYTNTDTQRKHALKQYINQQKYICLYIDQNRTDESNLVYGDLTRSQKSY